MKEFKDVCLSIIAAIPGEYSWEWDTRFLTMMVCMKENDSNQVKDKISGIFSRIIDSGSLHKATTQEKDLSKDLSGLKAGQLLFTYNYGENTLFGAWWPWGDGSKVSLRIGIYTQGADAEFESKVESNLKLWFGMK